MYDMSCHDMRMWVTWRFPQSRQICWQKRRNCRKHTTNDPCAKPQAKHKHPLQVHRFAKKSPQMSHECHNTAMASYLPPVKHTSLTFVKVVAMSSFLICVLHLDQVRHFSSSHFSLKTMVTCHDLAANTSSALTLRCMLRLTCFWTEFTCVIVSLRLRPQRRLTDNTGKSDVQRLEIHQRCLPETTFQAHCC